MQHQRSAYVGLRVPEDLKEALLRIAQREARTLSRLIRELLVERVVRQFAETYGDPAPELKRHGNSRPEGSVAKQQTATPSLRGPAPPGDN